MSKCGIYSIENGITDKRYYGSTCQWSTRKSNHRMQLRRGQHINRYLQSSWNKHGEDAFRFTFELSVHKPFLLWVEQIYLSANLDGYNLSRCAAAPTRGMKLPPASPERKRKISDSNRGQKRSESMRAKMRELKATLGMKWTDEHKEKTRQSLLGKKHDLSRRIASSIAHGRGYFKRRNAFRVTCLGHRVTVHTEAEAIAMVARIRGGQL